MPTRHRKAPPKRKRRSKAAHTVYDRSRSLARQDGRPFKETLGDLLYWEMRSGTGPLIDPPANFYQQPTLDESDDLARDRRADQIAIELLRPGTWRLFVGMKAILCREMIPVSKVEPRPKKPRHRKRKVLVIAKRSESEIEEFTRRLATSTDPKLAAAIANVLKLHNNYVEVKAHFAAAEQRK